MNKEKLSEKENFKYLVIKDLVNNKGNVLRASVKLNISKSQVYKLMKNFKTNGINAFSHKSKGTTPKNKIDDNTKNKIIDLYNKKYYDSNLLHFTELLKEYENINYSHQTIRNILKDAHIISLKAHKRTKKDFKKKLKEMSKKSVDNEFIETIEQKIERIDLSPHPKREKSKYFSELVQMDASSFKFLEDDITYHLHLAIDDCTNTVLGAYLDTQETLKGYYNILYQIILNYGTPAKIYTDRRTVFEYKKLNSKDVDKDTYTQFSYACLQLGIEIKTTSVAQAKGLIEKTNSTFQSRLPIDLRIAGIKSLEQANIFLKSYIKKYNDKFALQINNNKNVFEIQEDMSLVNIILGIISERTIKKDHSLKYINNYYFPINDNNEKIYFNYRTKVLVIKAFDGSLLANVDNKIYRLELITSHKEYSEEFDLENPKLEEKAKKKWFPPKNHPWRHFTFSKHLEKLE